jgi:hypothetical protein
MNDRTRRTTAVSRGVGFLAGQQLPHGELRTYRSDDPTLVRDPVFESSPYGTTYVLCSLGFVDDPRAAALAERALGFLAAEMEPPGLWRYYTSRNPKILPPDLDDTACASLALRDSHDEIRLGLNLRPILANRDEDGRFRTFLASPAANNVDAVVNANVVAYLGEREETRAACDYLCRVVVQGEEGRASLYGVDDLSFDYVLSRAYFLGVRSLEPCRAPMVRRILARQRDDGSFGDALATALACASLLNFEEAPADVLGRALAALLAQQSEDGSWPRSTFYIDFNGGFYGSEELTTAIALEALARAA